MVYSMVRCIQPTTHAPRTFSSTFGGGRDGATHATQGAGAGETNNQSHPESHAALLHVIR